LKKITLCGSHHVRVEQRVICVDVSNVRPAIKAEISRPCVTTKQSTQITTSTSTSMVMIKDKIPVTTHPFKVIVVQYLDDPFAYREGTVG
jgi:hypothetical protein